MKSRILKIREDYIPQTTDIVNYVKEKYIVLSVGVATFSFGFLAGALLNIYLLSIHSPLTQSFRASLSYKSSIFGDGIIFPIVNMVIANFLLKNKQLLTRKTVTSALSFGLLITLYFHINQAVVGLTNWTMPTPWHWNILGAFHALYMLSVTSLISVFYIVVIARVRKEKSLPQEAWIVSVGALIFLLLLRLDYIAVSFTSLLPKF